MARKHFVWLLNAMKSLSATIILLATLSIVWTIGPWVETNFFPVVEKLQINNLVEIGPNEVAFDAAFVKVRSCEYLGIGWYSDGTDGTERLPITIERKHARVPDQTPTRPPGYTFTGPWTVPLSKVDLMQHSHAVLFHRCHPFWVSTTNFYP